MQNSIVLDYQKYTDFLKNQIQFRYYMIIVFAVLFLIVVTLTLLGYMGRARSLKERESIKSKIAYILVWFCIFAVLVCILWIQIDKIKDDIEHQSYSVYEGEFVYKYTRRSKGSDTKLSFTVDGKEINLTTKDLNIVNGTYTGKIVYSEKTQYLLDYMIYENE